MFKVVDGLHATYAASVTVSTRGNIWVKHGDASRISVLDGYHIQTLPSAGRDSYRVYESRTGQLWSLYASGVAVYSTDQWVNHPVAEIRAELQSDPLRQFRQIPLLPAERDRVLFLLSDRLMEYDCSARRAVVLKAVTETGLGKFLEMVEARDGGIWITGTKGAAKLPGPLRHLHAGAPWEEFLVPATLHAEGLQRPFEDKAGGLTVAAMDPRLHGRRVLLRWVEGSWTAQPVETNIRQAWSAWDGVTWAYTVNSLLRFDPFPLPAFSREKLWAGQYNDVVTEPDEVFWLATSEGLLRYAPSLWRTPLALEELNSHVHAILEDGHQRLWLASGDFLFCLQQGGLRAINWPEGFEGTFHPTDALYELSDGRIAAGAGGRSLLFDPETDQFRYLQHPSGRQVRLLGKFLNGSVVVQVRAGDAVPEFELDRFDGNEFTVLAQSSPSWNLGPELEFAAPLANDDLWMGGAAGLGRLRKGVFDFFGPAQGFRESKASCLTEVGGGRLWCASADRILEFNGKSWSMVRGGFDRISALIRGPDDKTWVASADGLYCYANGSWVQHGVEEGLPSMGISEVFLDHQGRLWAGSTRGASLYHPESDLAAPQTLTPVLEDAKGNAVGEQPTVYFAAVDKWQNTPTARLLYSTRLDEGMWSPFTNSATKTFARLGAGKHHLEVRAMDRNWNEDPGSAALEFSVVLAWYRDPRLIGIITFGAVLVCFFAGLAVNRHFRLIRSYAEVERIVALRTEELERANQELLQSQKMKALGTLAAGIAHDFNNILSIIKGSAQIIESNLDDKQKIRTRVSRIQAVVEQGSSIVKSILGLSRVKDADLVKTDLNAVVQDAIRLLGDKFLHEATVLFRPTTDLPPVLVARELIQQMLLNLVLNAADAMDGRGQIVISTGELYHLPSDLALAPARAVSHLYLSVQDNGCGIPADILPRIFEPFFTTKALSARRGTGLGLSIVYELARQIGYGLEVRSAPGKGSTFRIILPARDSMAGL